MFSQNSSQFRKQTQYATYNVDLGSDEEDSNDSLENKLKLLRENKSTKLIEVDTTQNINSVSSQLTAHKEKHDNTLNDLFGKDDDDDDDDLQYIDRIPTLIVSSQASTQNEPSTFTSTQANTKAAPVSFFATPMNRKPEPVSLVSTQQNTKNEPTSFVTPQNTQKNRVSDFS